MRTRHSQAENHMMFDRRLMLVCLAAGIATTHQPNATADEVDIGRGPVRIHVPSSYDPAVPAPLVVLLHGFPELAFSWRHQLPALADAGYRAIAPDQRGYGLTDRDTRARHRTGS